MTSKNIPCTKAIIAIAGFGARRLPITKAIEKCMLPIGNRPIIDYMVDDCVRAGITDIILVVGEQSEQIRTYYGHNQLLEDYLVQYKPEALAEVSNLAVEARFHFVTQDHNQPYGTSVPIWLARDYIVQADEPFLYLYGDNIFYNPERSAIADFLQTAGAQNLSCAMMGAPVPEELVSHYGIIATAKRGGVDYFEHIVEKPKTGKAPSNLNNAGCFLLKSDIFPFVERGMSHPSHEQFFTDPLNWYYQAGNDIGVIRLSGEYLDTGTLEGWLYANNRILGHQKSPGMLQSPS